TSSRTDIREGRGNVRCRANTTFISRNVAPRWRWRAGREYQSQKRRRIIIGDSTIRTAQQKRAVLLPLQISRLIIELLTSDRRHEVAVDGSIRIEIDNAGRRTAVEGFERSRQKEF